MGKKHRHEQSFGGYLVDHLDGFFSGGYRRTTSFLFGKIVFWMCVYRHFSVVIPETHIAMFWVLAVLFYLIIFGIEQGIICPDDTPHRRGDLRHLASVHFIGLFFTTTITLLIAPSVIEVNGKNIFEALIYGFSAENRIPFIFSFFWCSSVAGLSLPLLYIDKTRLRILYRIGILVVVLMQKLLLFMSVPTYWNSYGQRTFLYSFVIAPVSPLAPDALSVVDSMIVPFPLDQISTNALLTMSISSVLLCVISTIITFCLFQKTAKA